MHTNQWVPLCHHYTYAPLCFSPINLFSSLECTGLQLGMVSQAYNPSKAGKGRKIVNLKPVSKKNMCTCLFFLPRESQLFCFCLGIPSPTFWEACKLLQLSIIFLVLLYCFCLVGFVYGRYGLSCILSVLLFTLHLCLPSCFLCLLVLFGIAGDGTQPCSC